MAKVIGVPAAAAASTIGFKAFGSAATLPLSEALREIACPLRFMIQGITIGRLGEPRSPIVEAIGMPNSMWVAWMSPLESESRIAAQLAPFRTVELMPYFLKSPFSWAITIGEQSVRAMMPKLRSVTSGASPAMVPAGTAPTSADAEASAAGTPQPAMRVEPPTAAAAARDQRRETWLDCRAGDCRGRGADFDIGCALEKDGGVLAAGKVTTLRPPAKESYRCAKESACSVTSSLFGCEISAAKLQNANSTEGLGNSFAAQSGGAAA